jgi:E3 ubiquitin-protein ligase UBR2
MCGEMLCSQPFCCQQEIGKKRVGNCTSHAYKCGNTCGLFLRVAECQVLLLDLHVKKGDDIQVRGYFIPAPYLDEYGETDQGLK